MCTLTRARRAAGGAIVCAALIGGPAAAQDMEPKSYSASPVGANFLVGSYSWSTGAVVFDPTLPLTDIHADVQGFVVAVGHSFNLFGDLGLVTAALPYALADVTGKIQEQAASTSRSGLADARFKLSVNLRGNPAMSARDFARAPRRTIVGASLSVAAPAGQYYDTKLINLGNNRWAFKPEVGISVPIRRVDADAYVGATFFTRNDDFYPGGLARTQDPVVAVQAHVSYTFRPRLWVAVDSTWYAGGSAQVEDGNPSSAVNNSRAGLTLSLPVGARYSFKVAYGSGVIVRTGTNFTTVAVAMQALWLSRR
jgi:Putative MetA-pathway of phenol degradation